MSDLNDPRVLFAAERTLLAWNRTSIGLIAFGFLIERSAIFADVWAKKPAEFEAAAAVWIGLAFILLGAALALVSVVQYRGTIRTLKPSEIPPGYLVNLPVYVNLLVALLGVAMAISLMIGG